MLPAVRAGARKTGRSLDNFRVCMKPLVATAATQDEMAQKIADARARIAFYASTPAYPAAFEHLGLGELVNRCRQSPKHGVGKNFRKPALKRRARSMA